MIGTAGLRGYRIDCIVGIYERERQHPQPIVMDIEFDYDFEKATETDQINPLFAEHVFATLERHYYAAA